MAATNIGCKTVDSLVCAALSRVLSLATPYVRTKLSALLCALALSNCSGKAESLAEQMGLHVSTVSRILEKLPTWQLRELACREAWFQAAQAAWKTGLPICATIDVATNPMRRPKKGATRPMEGGGDHFSRLLAKKWSAISAWQ